MPAPTWNTHIPPPDDFARSIGLAPVPASLLYNRGLRDRDAVQAFLSPDERDSHDPFLLPDMEAAVVRLANAVQDGEKIGVFGDFDTDGLTATAVLVKALEELGATAIPYLPDRTDEGHGLNALAVGSLRGQGISLMITVDCGSSDVEEIELASSLGIDTIVTDHHVIPAIQPPAIALVNPSRKNSRYPYGELTGAGLSYKLVEALWRFLGKETPEHLMELAAIGTIADVGPLNGENRYLVKKGIESLNRTTNPGLKALIARAGLKLGQIDSESLSFSLIPRLNAAGRLASPAVSLSLLTARSTEEAEPIADELEGHNDARRLISRKAVEQATYQVESMIGGPPSVIVVEHADWIPGILGLVAGSLAETYNRPVVALSPGDRLTRASMRSIAGFNAVDALTGVQEVLKRHGGHPMAAGFVVATSDLPQVKQHLASLSLSTNGNTPAGPSVEIDGEIAPASLDKAYFAFIDSLSPFGKGNPDPIFLTKNVVVAKTRRVGKQRDHLKMSVVHDRRMWEVIGFRMGDRTVAIGDHLDLVYTPGLDEWGGRSTLQLTLLDLRPAR